MRAPNLEPQPLPSRPTILLVEDEAAVALDVRRRLQRAGYEVVGPVDTGRGAIDATLESKPHLVLMDISLNGAMDGIEAAKHIETQLDVPVVFLTAYGDEPTLERAAQASPYGYLLKPFDDRSLLTTVRVAIERHASDTHQRLLSAAVASASVGIALVTTADAQRSIVFCNDAYGRLLDAPPSTLTGTRPCERAVRQSSPDLDRLDAAIDALAVTEGVVQLRTAGGELRWASVSVSPVAHGRGRPDYLLVFLTDITPRRLAEAALAESQRLELVGRLTAGIAHDFNNVLGAILAFTELVHADLPLDDARRDDLEEVLHAARRGASLTRKLLDFSLQGDGQDVRSAEAVQVLAGTRPMLEGAAGPKVRVHLQLPAEPLFVQAAPSDLEQVLLNLAANARDAMPSGGNLRIEAARPAVAAPPFEARRYVRLTVTDDGPGMPPEVAERVFEPFFTTKPRGAGTGLGLVTVRMLAQRAGGRASLETAPGEGTRFIIDMPVVDQPPAGADSDELPTSSTRAADGARVLLVEDEAPLRDAGARALRRAGFEVTAVRHGEAARDLLEQDAQAFDLLICDMVLPGIDGASVLRVAREKAPTLALLAMTGYFDRTADLPDTGTPVLWKPFTPTTLVRRALDCLHEAPAPTAGAAATDAATTRTAPPPPAPSAPMPVRPTPHERLLTLGTPQPTARPHRGTVLLVDDDPALRAALARVLTDHDYTALQAGSGAAGIRALQAGGVDLAVVDLHLPDGDGMVVADAAQALEVPVPVVVITGAPTIQSAQAAMRVRATGYLTKPIRPIDFLSEVERAVTAGQVARLQRQLLMSRSGAEAMLRDLPETRRRFEASLAELHMAFQPIVRAHDHSVFAYEALLRSRSDALRAPAELIAAAEALDAVERLGRATRRAVAGTLAEHPALDALVFVNLHPIELRAGLLGHPDEPLLPFADRVVLEVTERAELSPTTDLPGELAALRALGYRVALDDLGEGYAGLSWLVKLVPDIAKLDMSLVRDIDQSAMKRSLVGSMVGVCRRSGTVVVAEGIETSGEAQTLTDLGCDLLQGYHFARPGPPFPIPNPLTGNAE